MSSIYTKDYVRGKAGAGDNTGQQLESRRQRLSQEIEAEDDANKKRRNTRIVVWIIIVIIVIAAIAGAIYLLTRPKTAPGGGGGQTTSGTQVGGTCESSNTCATGLICSATLCKKAPQASCGNNSECPDKYNCIDGKCLGEPTSMCSNKNDCQSPLVCNDQACGVQLCNTQTICDNAHGGQCNGTTCVGLLGGICASTSDCAKPYHCNITTKKCSIQTCNSNTDCTNTNGPGPVLCGSGSPKTCKLDFNVACIEVQQCDSDPLGSPSGSLGLTTCDPIVKKCHAYSGGFCDINDSTNFAACLNGTACTPLVPPSGTLGACSCNESAQCRQALPVCRLDAVPASAQNTCIRPCTTNGDCTVFPYFTCGPDDYCIA